MRSFYSRYGSTAQYADWIAEATGLPVFDVRARPANPADFDFLVLGGPIIYHKLPLARWILQNRASIGTRPAILFSVSGAGAGEKLDGWIEASLPGDLVAHLKHIALRGRQDPKALKFFDRMMLIIGGLANRDRKAGREELHGFDFMDKGSIAPIIERIETLQDAKTQPDNEDAASE